MDYFNELDCAVTVCDLNGIVIYSNEKSCNTFAGGGNLIGQDLRECHGAASWDKIVHMLQSGESNSYTIEKNGQKKIIHQTPWRENGMVKGLVEFSIIIPLEMPHYVRG